MDAYSILINIIFGIVVIELTGIDGVFGNDSMEGTFGVTTKSGKINEGVNHHQIDIIRPSAEVVS